MDLDLGWDEGKGVEHAYYLPPEKENGHQDCLYPFPNNLGGRAERA